jgi:pimeloyl-ACP methyl ester carboxylesterase
VGTVDVARDLEQIRKAVGDARLTFIGHSYGTLLGATYADLFPTNVRAMVLDAAIDPALTTQQLALAQAKGFEAILGQFFDWCAGNTACSWRQGPDPRGAFLDLLSHVRATPVAAGSRLVGPGELLLGVLDTLYSPGYWPALGRALAGLAAGNGGALLSLSDSYQSGGSSNAADANTAITCLDHPVPTDLSAYPQAAADAAASAPVFGPLFAWGAVQCAVWPARPTRDPHAIHAVGAPPILVVGTTDDPATPHAWAESLAGELSKGVLLTRKGADHVAYYYSSCVRELDARYLIDLVAPENGTVCDS